MKAYRVSGRSIFANSTPMKFTARYEIFDRFDRFKMPRSRIVHTTDTSEIEGILKIFMKCPFYIDYHYEDPAEFVEEWGYDLEDVTLELCIEQLEIQNASNSYISMVRNDTLGKEYFVYPESPREEYF